MGYLQYFAVVCALSFGVMFLICFLCTLLSLQAFIQNLAMFFTAFFKVFFLKPVFACLCVFYFKEEFGSTIWTLATCSVCSNLPMLAVSVAHWGVGVQSRESNCFVDGIGVLDRNFIC